MNKMIENVRVAFTAILTNRFRALLTTIGIGIGIASVVILVTVGQAVQGYITNQFLGVGSDLVFVRPVVSVNGPPGSGQSRNGMPLSSLTEQDVALVRDPFNLPNVRTVVPLVQLQRNAERGQNAQNTFINSTTAQYFDALNRTVSVGRVFEEAEVLSGARVAVIGQTTAKNLFLDESPLNEDMRIGGVTFRVIGVLDKFGGSSFGLDQDDIIVIPITTAQTRLATDRSLSGQMPISQIYVQVSTLASIDQVVESTRQLIRARHKIKPGKDDNFTVTSQKDLLSSFTAVIGVLTIFLSVIGGISLVVGGIGVMNIMLVTVTERTREIGLRKAVGARNFDVILQFLTESVFLCAIGGLAGLVLAFVVTTIIRAVVPTLDTSVSIGSIALAIGVTTLVGVFFGLYPASRAAALSPIQALRTE